MTNYLGTSAQVSRLGDSDVVPENLALTTPVASDSAYSDDTTITLSRHTTVALGGQETLGDAHAGILD